MWPFMLPVAWKTTLDSDLFWMPDQAGIDAHMAGLHDDCDGCVVLVLTRSSSLSMRWTYAGPTTLASPFVHMLAARPLHAKLDSDYCLRSNLRVVYIFFMGWGGVQGHWAGKDRHLRRV